MLAGKELAGNELAGTIAPKRKEKRSMDAHKNAENRTGRPPPLRWLARQWAIAAASCSLVCLAVYHDGDRRERATGRKAFAAEITKQELTATTDTIRLAVDLNRATALELCLLPGIGPGLSARILTYRDANGPFQNLEQLDQVDGIGPRRLAQLRPYVLEFNASY